MKIVAVAAETPYEVRIGRGLLRGVSQEAGRFSRCAILTDENVGPLYLARLADLDAPSVPVPAGEASKSMRTLERVLEFMAESDLDRGSCLVALGGGVVGDLGGLAASLYMRGIAVIQAPTTLLAQVDASVGGKTAVDLAAGKNLAGTFHAPACVIADTETLATLPERELLSGLGEALKSAVIEGEEALSAIERQAGALRRRDPDALESVVERCVRTKARIVAADPRERGGRKALNLGHTFAHAIEKSAGYGTVPHGIAVAAGLGLALRTSLEIGFLQDRVLPARVERILVELGLPRGLASLRAGYTSLPDPSRIQACMRHDKKGASGAPRFVLPRRAGDIGIDVEVDPARISAILARE